jgi:hypothetical protein
MSATSENAINKHGNIIGTQDVNTKIQVADQSHSSLYSIDHQGKYK